MSQWQDEAILMLRVLINDVGGSPTYSDQQLEDILIVSARYVNQELDWTTTYTINLLAITISPDPLTKTSVDGYEFLNFIVLKSACIIDQSTFRSKALLEGINARCGPATLAVSGHLKGFRELVEIGPCAAYDKLKLEHELGNANACRAVLSPFVSNDFDPESLAGIRDVNSINRGDVW